MSRPDSEAAQRVRSPAGAGADPRLLGRGQARVAEPLRAEVGNRPTARAAVAAAVARLLLDVRSLGWTIVSWVLYVLAMLPVVWVILVKLTGGLNRPV